jgi:hypothetical protein
MAATAPTASVATFSAATAVWWTGGSGADGVAVVAMDFGQTYRGDAIVNS